MDHDIVQLVANGGALVILGYHLLISLPRMMEKWIEEQRRDREFFSSQMNMDRQNFEARARLIANEIKALAEKIRCPEIKP